MAQITSLLDYSQAKEFIQQPHLFKDNEVRMVALRVYETIYGSRSVSQLSKHVSPDALNQILIQRSLRTERNTVYSRNQRVVPIPGRVTRSIISPEKFFCVVVLHTSSRSYALTMCFEFFRFGWRATEASLL